MMYHSDLYNEHNESLDRFIKLFNSAEPKNLLMIRKPVEDYKHDGLLINLETGHNFGFDWTKSQHTLFNQSNFIYKYLGCINTKLNTKSSQLFITTDCNEQQIAIAWRNDFLQEPINYFSCIYDGQEIFRKIRYTDKYKIYTYNNIKSFKEMINNALLLNKFNHTIFNTEGITL